MPALDPQMQSLQDELFLAKVAQAKRRTMGEKSLDGERLFHENAVWMKAGIRTQHPEWTKEAVESEYRRRLAIARELDDELFRRVGSLCV
jgi:hypothetical protein